MVPYDKAWATQREGAARVGSKHDTQGGAIDAARERAKRDGVEVVIHGRDGQIRDSDSYGPDPKPPKDQKRTGKARKSDAGSLDRGVGRRQRGQADRLRSKRYELKPLSVGRILHEVVNVTEALELIGDDDSR